MATVLTETGIIFNDGTTLNSKYGIVPQNSLSVFYQANAPTGWTRSTAHNNKALRVVSGTGGGSGGSINFTTAFPNSLRPVSVPSVPMSGSVGNHTLSTPQLPSHTHANGGFVGLTAVPFGQGDVNRAAGWSRSSPSTGATGGGGAHNHPWSGTASFSTNVDLRVQYIDVIVCSLN
jgi:hypothetical protein